MRNLRNAKASSGSAAKLAKIKIVRKNIARNLTILNQKERITLAGNLHQNSKKRAQFLRTKLTRAFRTRLSQHQKTKQILKVQKRQQNFPLRNFGLRAWVLFHQELDYRYLNFIFKLLYLLISWENALINFSWSF